MPVPAEGDDRFRHRFPELLGLYTLALAQPLFSLVTHSPEFFSARKTPAAAVLIFALTVAFGPPLLALLAERLAEAARRGWGARLHDALRLVALTAIALGAAGQLTTRLGVPGWLLVAAAIGCGAGALALLRRSRTCAQLRPLPGPRRAGGAVPVPGVGADRLARRQPVDRRQPARADRDGGHGRAAHDLAAGRRRPDRRRPRCPTSPAWHGRAPGTPT